MIYTYLCNDCQKGFCLAMPLGNYLRIRDKVVCPYCFSRDTKRAYEPTPVIYKGDGFTKSINKEEVK